MKLFKKGFYVVLLLLALVGAAGVFAQRYLAQASVWPAGLIQANGRLEGDNIIVASKTAGRIIMLLAREGDAVTAGQILARLDDEAARSRVAQAQAARDAATARLESAKLELSILRQQVLVDIASAQAGIRSLESTLEKTEATKEQANRDAQRFRKLAQDRTVDLKTAEQAELSWKLAQKESEAVQAGLMQAQQALLRARLGPERIKAQETAVAGLMAAVQEAQARVVEAQTALDELTIVSPAAGTVTIRFADLGEIVNPGAPLFELVDLDKLYLKVYVPEVNIGKLRLGLPAQIYTDAFPDEPFPATLRQIAARAEFTPKEVQTPDERVKLVYAMKLYLEQNPEHRLTPGLPGDAVIRWQEDAPWTKPRW